MRLFLLFIACMSLLSHVHASAYYIFISSGSFNGSDSLDVADALCESDFVSLGLNLAGSHSGSFIYNSNMFNYFLANSVPSTLIYSPTGQLLSNVSDFSGPDQTLVSTLLDAGACSPNVTAFWTGFFMNLEAAQTCHWTTEHSFITGMSGGCTETTNWSGESGSKSCTLLFPVMCMYQGSTHAPTSSPVKHPSPTPTKHPSKSPSKAPLLLPPSSHPTASPLALVTASPTPSGVEKVALSIVFLWTLALVYLQFVFV